MSPTSSVGCTVAKAERDLGGKVASMATGGKDVGFQFGIRKQESNGGGSPLKVSKDSHRIRKPPLPLPQVQYRPPIIIHTYSPKVIHTQPDDFMSLVQKLTGSSDTRLRLKKSPAKKEKGGSRSKDVVSEPISGGQSADASSLERQGSGSSATTNCGSPSSSDDSAFLVSDPCSGEATIKQSDSPRSPLDFNVEFDHNDLMFSQFDPSAGNLFSQVKTEPMFAFENSFNFFADMMHPAAPKAAPKPLSRPPMQQEMSLYGNVDVNSPLPSPGFLSPNLMNGLPDLSPGWSQGFVDSLGGSAPSHFMNLAPYQRQRPRHQFLEGYLPSSEGTMVALENIHAFLLP